MIKGLTWSFGDGYEENLRKRELSNGKRKKRGDQLSLESSLSTWICVCGIVIR